MDELIMTLAVAGLFLLRIGLPVAVLVGLGVLIDRWQTRREHDIERYQTGHKA